MLIVKKVLWKSVLNDFHENVKASPQLGNHLNVNSNSSDLSKRGGGRHIKLYMEYPISDLNHTVYRNASFSMVDCPAPDGSG